MAASSVENLSLSDQREAQIFALFDQAEFQEIAPSILQPADIYLDQIGEALRGRTYVFTDISGIELCLRPDLTVPAGRYFVTQLEKGVKAARYSYRGPAFRYPPKNEPSVGNPREFRQLGIEVFGDKAPVRTEVEVLELLWNGIVSAGLHNFQLRMGDLQLFEGFLEALDMPDHWQQRLRENFWRAEAFQDLLKSLRDPSSVNVSSDIKGLMKEINLEDSSKAVKQVSAYLDAQAIPLIGARSIEEVTANLVERAADMRMPALDPHMVDLIDRYLAISAPPRAAAACLSDLAETSGLEMGKHIDHFNKRLDLMEEKGLALDKAIFTAEFGRNMEYYTGFVFQFEIPDRGKAGHIAGGGRYDRLIQSLSKNYATQSVGGAIHMERLLFELEGLNVEEGQDD